MNFSEHARREAQILLDAVAEEVAKATRTGLDALRAEVDVRAAALENVLSSAEHPVLLARLLKELSSAAREEAETIAARVRLDTEKLAEEKLATARADAAAHAEAARAEAAQHLDEAQRNVVALRTECDRQRDSLEQADAQFRTIDAEQTQLLLAQEELRAQLGAEIQGRTEHRENLELAGERIRTLEEMLADSEADKQARLRRKEEDQDSFLMLLDGMRSAIGAIHCATTPNDILDRLIEHIGGQFQETAVFLVGRGIQGWRARRLGATTDFRGVVIPVAVISLLTRIVASRESLAVVAPADEPFIGLANRPIADAIALPLCANGRVLAVVYAEDAKTDGVGAGGVGFKMAEILVEQATRRLTKRTAATARAERQTVAPLGIEQPKAPPPNYSSVRQAHRVKMQASVDITLDGSASFLIDLSSLGAQVLSPLALRPNRLVQMELVGGEQTVQCKGRVVWVFFEHPKGTTAALYRAGVQFAEVDPHAVDAFLAHHGVPRDFAQGALNTSDIGDGVTLRFPHGAEKSTAS